MRRQHRRFYFLLITTLLLSSCQGAEPAISISGSQPSLPGKVNPSIISIFAQQTDVTSGIEANECLSCHSDKDRLIETAKEEEVVESESSGVG